MRRHRGEEDKFCKLFGDRADAILDDLNAALARRFSDRINRIYRIEREDMK